MSATNRVDVGAGPCIGVKLEDTIAEVEDCAIADDGAISVDANVVEVVPAGLERNIDSPAPASGLAITDCF